MYNKVTLVYLAILPILAYSQGLTLRSKQLGGQFENAQIFDGFGCNGENRSPQLYWEHIPEGTQSFAITMYDESAPTGSGWWHWLVFDIPSSVKELVAGAGNPNMKLLPQGVVQSKTDYGTLGYGGPCPPVGHGVHMYLITIYALKVAHLGLNEDASPALVGYYLGQNMIQKATIVCYHKR